MRWTGVTALIALALAYVRWAYPGPRALVLEPADDDVLRLHCLQLREGDPRLEARWGSPVAGSLAVSRAGLSFVPAGAATGRWQAAMEDVEVTAVHGDDGRVTPSLDVRIVGVGARRLRVSDRPIRRWTIDHTTVRREALAAEAVHGLLLQGGARRAG